MTRFASIWWYVFGCGCSVCCSCAEPNCSWCALLCSELEEKAWARVSWYHGSRGKHGRLKLREVLSFPKCKQAVKFPPTLLPSNKVHVQVPGSSGLASAFTLHLHGVPRTLPLGLAIVECMLRQGRSAAVLTTCLQMLSSLLERFSLPPLLKEILLRQSARVVTAMQGKVRFSVDLHKALLAEFQEVYEAEVKGFAGSDGLVTFPPAESIAGRGKGRFTTYLQALFELCHATLELHLVTPLLETPRPPPGGRVSAYEKMSRKVSRPIILKSLSCDTQPVGPPPTADTNWINIIHEALVAIEDVVTSGIISLHHVEDGLLINPQSRLLVITGLSPTEEVQMLLKDIAARYGGLYQDTMFVQERGVVLEVSFGSKTRLLSSKIWENKTLKTLIEAQPKEPPPAPTPSQDSCPQPAEGEALTQPPEGKDVPAAHPDKGEVKLKIFAVSSDLTCEDEEGAAILKAFLTSLLSRECIAKLQNEAREGRMGFVSQLVKAATVEEVTALSEEEFAEKILEQDVADVWKTLLQSGIDFHFSK